VRADRLLSILLLLQSNQRMTATALARRLEVSPRTVQRDMEALSMAGVPVYAERGAGGGWVLPDSFRTDLTGLTGTELQALLVATPARLLSDLGLARASDSALVKLLASLPAVARRDADLMRQRILVDGAGWHQAADAVPALELLHEALWLGRAVRIIYTRRDDEAVERQVDPLGLVAKGRLWYFVAAVGGEFRTYRVSRMQQVEVLERPAERPPDFDLAAFWAASSAQFVANLPRFPITVRVTADAARRLWIPGAYARVEHIGSPDPDGWQTANLLSKPRMRRAVTCWALGIGCGCWNLRAYTCWCAAGPPRSPPCTTR
jgi:predicted DNA-binding transcriptional regulator YafY